MDEPRQRILLVDDSPVSRRGLADALWRQGFEVVAAGDLDELDAALERQKPDLILLDLQLPDVFGGDLVPWLRETRRVDRPVLLYAMRPADELRQLADEFGADGFVPKTGRHEEEAALVERFLMGEHV